MLDWVGFAVVGLFMLLGAMRGTLASFLHIASLGLAYAAGFYGAPLLGPLLAASYELPHLVALGLGGALAFVASYLLLGIASQIVTRIAAHRRRGRSRSGLDRFVGAMLGGCQGMVVAVLLGVLFAYLSALQHSPLSDMLPELPDTDSSRLVSVSQGVLEQGAEVAFGDRGPAGRMAVGLLARPGEMLEKYDRVLNNPHVVALGRDTLFWKYIEHGAIDQGLNQASFLGIAYDDTLRGELADLGIVRDSARVDSRLFRTSAREVLKEIGPRLKRVKSDPAFQELVEDPSVGAALKDGSPFALIQDPRFRSLINQVLDNPN